MNQINPGDTVTLVSSVQHMSVGVVTDEAALCYWHDRSGKAHEGHFAIAALVRVNDGSEVATPPPS